jgi:hypothetical protein
VTALLPAPAPAPGADANSIDAIDSTGISDTSPPALCTATDLSEIVLRIPRTVSPLPSVTTSSVPRWRSGAGSDLPGRYMSTTDLSGSFISPSDGHRPRERFGLDSARFAGETVAACEHEHELPRRRPRRRDALDLKQSIQR